MLLSQFETSINKKRESEKLIMRFGVNESGEKDRTCDLVLQKHLVRILRQTPKETSEALAS